MIDEKKNNENWIELIVKTQYVLTDTHESAYSSITSIQFSSVQFSWKQTTAK